MLLKGKIKLKVWGWLLKKDQVSEDDKRGKQCETSNMSDWCVLYQETLKRADAKSNTQYISMALNKSQNLKLNICTTVWFYVLCRCRKSAVQTEPLYSKFSYRSAVDLRWTLESDSETGLYSFICAADKPFLPNRSFQVLHMWPRPRYKLRVISLSTYVEILLWHDVSHSSPCCDCSIVRLLIGC